MATATATTTTTSTVLTHTPANSPKQAAAGAAAPRRTIFALQRPPVDGTTSSSSSNPISQEAVAVAQHLREVQDASQLPPLLGAVPAWKWNNLVLGPPLGQGKFGTVHQVTVQQQQKYALKQVRKDLYPKERIEAACDLAREGWLLQHLQQQASPHIVKLVATVEANDASFALILEELGPNLWDQIFHSDKTFNKHRAIVQVAQGMAFLHAHRILFRDLKLENVAPRRRLDQEDSTTWVLLDFGLAKELKAKDRIATTTAYHATQGTGTLRIMAPEVLTSTTYGLAADVYSFAIFLWEVASGQVAPQEVDANAHAVWMHTLQQRPSLEWCGKESSSSSSDNAVVVWRDLITCCWDPNPQQRPSFATLVPQLQTMAAASFPLLSRSWSSPWRKQKSPVAAPVSAPPFL